MDIFSIILIGIGLAMDCFAVSTTKGVTCGNKQPGISILSSQHKWGGPFLMAIFFGLFQGSMPLIGYFAGTIFADFFSRFAPWIALILLSFIGGKMVWESLRPDTESSNPQPQPTSSSEFTIPTLVLLAIATSIDALATGVIFIPCPQRVWIGVSIIAITSFLFSIIGYIIGRVCGTRFHFNVELLGGIILVLIGLKIWAEGLFF